MKIKDICPSLYRLSYFTYTKGEHRWPKIALDKSQYVYRILLIDKGALDVCVGNTTARLCAGDALYLLPGECYRLSPSKEDFALYNLFFDFLDERPMKESKHTACVFMKYYDASLCLSQIEFEDAPMLNRSGIVKSASPGTALKELLDRDPADALYDFYARSALFSVIADLLSAQKTNKPKSSNATPILDYIKANPEKDLSGEALSKLFSYHKNHINKLVKQETGRSLGAYIRHIRIEYAKTLLMEGLYSTSEVALRLGYYDYSHFYKAFLLETGARPTDYLPTKR